MGSYTFRWDHSAEEVYVTGTFDDWKKTVRLDKTHYGFERDVNLPDASQKILYKFVADGVWLHDHTGKTETDHEGNVNNVLYPEDIKPPNSMAYQFSSAAPGATTAELAGQQPLEKQTSNSSMPGGFPETPAFGDAKDTEDKGGLSGAVAGAAAGAGAVAASAAAAVGLSSGKNKENEKEQQFSVNPIPASAGASNPIQLAPGQQVPNPSTINNNTVSSTVRDDPSLKAASKDSDQTFGVSPLPATGGIGNPVTLQPGQKVPDSGSLTGNTINSNVRLDQASYEKSGSGAPQLPPVVSPASESAGGSLGGAALFSGLGPQTTNIIPESSMGMGKDAPSTIDRAFSQEEAGPTLSSAAPTSTTAALAGRVPKEPRGVPEVVTESQKEAHVGPEAAANPEAVLEKKQVENELKNKVPEEPAAKSDNSGAIAGGLVDGAAAGGLGAAAISSVAPTSTTNNLAGQVPKETRGVPEVVSESQEKAHVAPEAAANPEAVQDKKDVESELKAKIPEEPASTSYNNGVTGAVAGGLAAAGAAAAGGAAYVAKKTHETTGTDPTKALPESVQQKINEQNSQSGTTTSGLTSTSAVPAQKGVGEGITPISNGTGAKTADAVPAEVQASQKEAHVSPGAAANAEAVHEKSDVEKELLKKVPTSQATGEPAPTVAAATSATAPGATTGTSSSGAPQLGAVGGIAPISMEEKPKDGLNASASSQAQAQTQSPVGAQDSRDVSPMSKPATNITDQTQPIVTTGVASAEAPKTSGKDVATAAAQTAASKPIGTPRNPQTNPSTPQKRNSIMGRFGKGTPDSSHGTPDSAEGSAKKKGFFSKLKEKLKN